MQANINKLGNLDLGTLECNEAGSFQVASQTLEDLAKLIDDVGIESLCNQLDLDLDCTFKRKTLYVQYKPKSEIQPKIIQ